MNTELDNNREFYFENIDELVSHLYSLFGKLTPLKLQKSLYFLFSFYSGIYSGEDESGVQEESYDMPKYLFDADFEAWTYGPVIPKVYKKNKYDGGYESKEYDFDENKTTDNEIDKFIQDVGGQIVGMSDFALVDRSHEDITWKKSIEQRNSAPMKREDIASEYRKLITEKN